MCNLCTPRPIFRPTYWPTLDWSISRYINWHLTDLSVDISTDTRPTYRPRYVGQHLARVSSADDTSTVNGGCLVVGWHVNHPISFIKLCAIVSGKPQNPYPGKSGALDQASLLNEANSTIPAINFEHQDLTFFPCSSGKIILNALYVLTKTNI